MGGACCTVKAVNCEYNISSDNNTYSKGKNELKCKTINTLSCYDRLKDEDRCSILVNSFCKDTNYIVSYKESQERKRIENRFRNNKI